MTPQKALAQALPGTYELEAWAEDMRRADLDHDEVRTNLAAAILDALPEPMRRDVPAWVDGWDKGREVGRREGAQQERERLRARHAETHHQVIAAQDNVTILSCPTCFIFDPEDDR